MVNDSIKAVLTGSNNRILKEMTLEKPNAKSLSSLLKLVKTEINEFLTELVNEAEAGGYEGCVNVESADESNDSIDIDEIKTTGVKRKEQNMKLNKKVKT